MDTTLVSTKEMAVRYTAHPKTVLKWVKAKILPVTRINKRCLGYERANLRAGMYRTKLTKLFSIIQFKLLRADQYIDAKDRRGETLNGARFKKSSSRIKPTNKRRLGFSCINVSFGGVGRSLKFYTRSV